MVGNNKNGNTPMRIDKVHWPNEKASWRNEKAVKVHPPRLMKWSLEKQMATVPTKRTVQDIMNGKGAGRKRPK